MLVGARVLVSLPLNCVQLCLVPCWVFIGKQFMQTCEATRRTKSVGVPRDDFKVCDRTRGWAWPFDIGLIRVPQRYTQQGAKEGTGASEVGLRNTALPPME